MDIRELKERQGWTLEQKIDHSLGVLDQFISHCGGLDKAYVSFSGGKDSTVLLDIARRVFGKDVRGMFTNTGLEYPDIVKFVRGYENVDIIRPKISHKEVVERYGFPLVDKETAYRLHHIKHRPHTLCAKRALGLVPTESKFKGVVAQKWRFLASKEYSIHNICCDELKKKPAKRYEKETGRHPIVGVMADESSQRQSDYVNRGGCNTFGARSNSHPLSIWTEKDIYDYIAKYKLPISEIYAKGATRTGCMFCGFGCHFKNDGRFELLQRVEPKAYAYCMKLLNNGVTYREALRDVLAVNKLYLPDEEPLNLFNYQK